MRTPRCLAVMAVVAALLSTMPASAAWARHGSSDVTVVTAPCADFSTSLTLRSRNSGIETEYELDQQRSGKTWKVALTRNGTVAARAKRTTGAPSGSFTWRVFLSGATSSDTITVSARRGGVTCTIRGQLASASASQSGTTDTITVSKCFTNATKSSGGELLIKASSSDPNATLTAYRPDGSVIGEVQNGGGSRYGGTVMPYQPNDPGTITIVSSSGGRITVPTGPFQL